jgi:hypothetical protein
MDETIHPGTEFKTDFQRVGKAFHQQNEAGRRIFLNLFLCDIILHYCVYFELTVAKKAS